MKETLDYRTGNPEKSYHPDSISEEDNIIVSQDYHSKENNMSDEEDSSSVEPFVNGTTSQNDNKQPSAPINIFSTGG